MAHPARSSSEARAISVALVVVLVGVSAIVSIATLGVGAATSGRGSAALGVADHPNGITRCPPCIIDIVTKNLPKIGGGAGPHDPAATWGVAVSGVENGELTVTNTTEISLGGLPNGIYHFLIVGPAGWTAANESGSVTLNNDNATVMTAFTKAPTHDLVVRESGLPKGTLWCATVASALTMCSSATTQRADNLTPAVYNFSVAEVPGYELKTAAPTTVDLTDGTLIVHLVYRATIYTLTFEESGLAPATAWHLTLSWTSGSPAKSHHESRSTSGSSVVFDVTNGTYNYTVKPIGGYSLPTPTPVVVDGAAVVHDVVFTPVPSEVTFQETGLTAGQNWSITIDSVTYVTNQTELVVSLTDGKYGYSIGAPTGFTAHGSPVVVKVVGQPVSVKVVFRA